MQPLIDNILQTLGCTLDDLRCKMLNDDKVLREYLRKLPIYYNHTAVEFHGFSMRDAETEPFSATMTVKQFFEWTTNKPIKYPWLPCIVQITDGMDIDKYPLEYLFSDQ